MLGFTLALVVLPATVIALLVACLQDPHGRPRHLDVRGREVSATRPPWTPPLRYADVLEACVDPDGVILTTRDGPVMVPMGQSLLHEREHLAAQVLSAAARARGEGPPPPALPTSLARLAPRGETERAWLERVDARRRLDRLGRRVPRDDARSPGPLDRAREPRRAAARPRRRRPGPGARRARGGEARVSPTCSRAIATRTRAPASASPSRTTSTSPRESSRASRLPARAEARGLARVSPVLPTPGASGRARVGSPCAASSASHAASAAAIVVKYGMFASSVCRRSE